jgi:hypothetical protein
MRVAVVATDRVDSGTVVLRRRSARIVARANTHTIEGLDADIRRRVEGLLRSISLVEPPRLKIKAYPAAAPPAPTVPTVPTLPKSDQTPVGVSTGAEQPATTAGEQPVPTPPAPVAAPPPAEQVRTPAASQQDQPASTPKPEPEARPSPKPEVTEQSTAGLDDLLSAPEDDESR